MSLFFSFYHYRFINFFFNRIYFYYFTDCINYLLLQNIVSQEQRCWFGCSFELLLSPVLLIQTQENLLKGAKLPLIFRSKVSIRRSSSAPVWSILLPPVLLIKTHENILFAERFWHLVVGDRTTRFIWPVVEWRDEMSWRLSTKLYFSVR